MFKSSYLLCCKTVQTKIPFLFSVLFFSKYVDPTEANLFFPTSEHQALIYPLGVELAF